MKKNKRKPILMNKIGKMEKEESKKQNIKLLQNISRNTIIAFASTHEGAGCTFNALGTAFDLSQKYRTALIELDPNCEINGFDEVYGLPKNEDGSFKLDGLDIYPYEEIAIVDILKQSYDYIILDMGAILEVSYQVEDKKCVSKRHKYFDEAYKAAHRILITQINDWKKRYIVEMIHNEGIEGWKIGVNLSNKGQYKELQEILLDFKYEEIISIPYIEDPFEVRENTFINFFME